MIENQELYCHNCDKYVQFPINLELNGNHVLNCPNCGHEHCRVVKNGRITSDRWDSRNPNYYISNTNVTVSNNSTWTSYASVSTNNTGGFLYSSWFGTITIS